MRIFAFTTLLAVIAAACGPGAADNVCDLSDGVCRDGGATDGDPSDGSGGGDGSGGDGSLGCNASGDPKDDIDHCVTNEAGLFVNPAGDDSDGTREHAFKTIGKALQSVNGKARVFVCVGTYPENVIVPSSVAIYGGFACDFRSHSNARPKVAPTSGTAALTISGSTVLIEDMEFYGPDYTPGTHGESSIAAIVNGTHDVTFTRVRLQAQNGGAGENGAPIAPFPNKAADGNSANGNTGGFAQPLPAVACENGTGTTQGGGGGYAGGGSGLTGKPVYNPAIPSAQTGRGGATDVTYNQCTNGPGYGITGSNGPAGTDGPGARSIGTLDGTTWIAGTGTAGTPGNVGQGGGGGAGESAGGGGGGGAGGCGGLGGTFGKGGGASIGLLSVGSTVTLHASTVSAGAGGNGGNGAVGQTGQRGGASASGAVNGCSSGAGGNGGNGGGGGGGAGGVSFGILFKDTPPETSDDTQVSKGSEGLGGSGQPNSGVPGKSAFSYNATQL